MAAFPSLPLGDCDCLLNGLLCCNPSRARCVRARVCVFKSPQSHLSQGIVSLELRWALGMLLPQPIPPPPEGFMRDLHTRSLGVIQKDSLSS